MNIFCHSSVACFLLRKYVNRYRCMLSSPPESSKSTIQCYLPQIFVTSLNTTKYLAEQLLVVHLSTSHITLGNAGHYKVEQRLILQFEHIIPNEQSIQP